VDTTIAAASLVFGGVMERHPGLKICLSHGGGFVPYQAARWVHGWQVRGEPKVNLKISPQDSLARFYYDTILHGAPALEFLVRSAGAGHVLLGSDYPFDMERRNASGRCAPRRSRPPSAQPCWGRERRRFWMRAAVRALWRHGECRQRQTPVLEDGRRQAAPRRARFAHPQ